MIRKLFLLALVGLGCADTAAAAEPASLPGTKPLEWNDDLSVRMMDGLHRYIEAKIVASVDARKKHWQRDFTSPAAYEKSIEPNRRRFQQQIGLVDARPAPRLERFSINGEGPLIAEMDRYRVYQVRWDALDGVTAEGLLFEPRKKPVARVVALPDATQTPEQIAGLAEGVATQSQFARRLAEDGFQVLVPTLIDRTDQWSGNPRIGYTNQTHREWIYRQAYQMGRHIIGYEVHKVLAAVDWFAAENAADEKTKIGVVGYGEGGLIAFYAAACDPRIDACLVSGYFQERSKPWEEPLDRNVWGLLREFGDAEIATLIAPRSLTIEYSQVPKVEEPLPVRPGRKKSGAVGRLETPDFASVNREFMRAGQLVVPELQSQTLQARRSRGGLLGPASNTARMIFATALWPEAQRNTDTGLPRDLRRKFEPRDRQRRQVQELERHVQRLLREADATRDEQFLGKPEFKTRSADEFAALTPAYRQKLWNDLFGRFDDRPLALNPRSRQIYDRPKWTGYDVVLDVFPDVFAWGVLLLPKDLKPGERRPVVVCQHGRNGLPRDTIEGDLPAYHDFAARLADRGFIVFAPHNPYRGEDRYRFLSRKANSLGASLFSFILAQHEQILNYLQSLPQVDPQRIAFYGLSYGGETAVRVPPLLERYCLSICSADFNDWARKVSSTDARCSFMFTIEWEMPYFNLGSTFNYAEMAALMVPRPFMVERGHADGVAPDEWVAYEYAKVRRLYDQLGLGDRTEIEFFDGPHTIHGVGTFRFLEKHLQWNPTQP